MQASEEIKARIDIVDLIREYINLQPAGVNFRARCPFHREKSPSFIVSPEKQIWHCFGCGRGGDIFSFLMELEGINFVEALRILAPKAGVSLKQQDPKISSERNRIMDIMDISRRFYHKNLLESPYAKNARDYLLKRGLKKETIEEWQIGFSLDSWDSVINILKNKGFKENEIFLAGMIVRSEKSNRFYDRFRGRIMFPIMDVNSNTVAFSARVSPEKEEQEKMGKYINSPQTPVYDKSKILFGLDKSKMAIKSEDLAIIVEGQMDVVSAHQAGFKNVIASSGTALSQEQIILIKRFTNNLAFAFDQDSAGISAADRGMGIASQLEMNIKVIEVPDAKDPDECIRKNPDTWRKAVGEASLMMEYYFKKYLNDLNADNIEDKNKAVQLIIPKIYRLGNKIEQDHWLKKLGEKMDIEINRLKDVLKKIKNPEIRIKKEEEPTNPKILKSKTKEEKMSEILNALLIKFSPLLEYTLKYLSLDYLHGEENKDIYKKLILYYNNIINEEVNFANYEQESKKINARDNNFRTWLKENKNLELDLGDQLNFFDKLVILGDEEFYKLDFEQAKNELIKILRLLKKEYLNKRMRELEKLISQSEKENLGNIQDLMEEFKNLLSEYKDLG
jgi:DNA primase